MSSPSTTAGTFSTAPTPRMATCGWLITGVAKILPKLPKFVIENVPPCTSSGFNCRARASRQIDNRSLQTSHILFVGIADHRHDQAAFERHRDADIDVSMVDDTF